MFRASLSLKRPVCLSSPLMMQEAASPKVAVRPERRRQHATELASSVNLAFEVLTRWGCKRDRLHHEVWGGD